MARTGRTARGAATRTRIIGAANRLFLRDGYLDTTMASIAAEADVAVQTLYVSFGSKDAILAACHDVAVAGDEEPIPVLERSWVSEFRQEDDGHRALDKMLDHTLAIVERAAPIQAVIRAAAADPEVAQMQVRNKANRYITLRALIEVLATKPGFHGSVDQAADLLYAFISEDFHQLLVVERNWPVSEWKQWVKSSLASDLFPPRTGSSSTKRPALRRR